MCTTQSHSTRCQTLQAQHAASMTTAGRPANPWAVPLRPRVRRVLYPPTVRRHLPTEKPDPARRWLALLSALLFLQIYTEEVPCGAAAATGAGAWDRDPLQTTTAATLPNTHYQGASLQECEAGGLTPPMGELLQWGAQASTELDMESVVPSSASASSCCGELSGSVSGSVSTTTTAARLPSQTPLLQAGA